MGTPMPTKPSGQKGAKRNLSAEMVEGRAGVDDLVCHIKRSLLCDALGEQGSLGDVEVKASILLQASGRA